MPCSDCSALHGVNPNLKNTNLQKDTFYKSALQKFKTKLTLRGWLSLGWNSEGNNKRNI